MLFSMFKSNNKISLVLFELFTIALIVSVVTIIALPSVFGVTLNAKEKTDEANLRTLNVVTDLYRTAKNDFNEKITDEMRIQALIDGKYLSEEIVPTRVNYSFKWSDTEDRWYLDETEVFPYELSVLINRVLGYR